MLCSCFALAQQTLEVGKLKQFSTIKQAIKVAKDGDHVVVYPGV
jgi:hypothetical protein